MLEPQNMPTGFYRVRDGFHPSGVERWRVAQWMPQCAWRENRADVPGWRMGDDKFPAGYWQEIGAKVA